jgi:hypothetical protein
MLDDASPTAGLLHAVLLDLWKAGEVQRLPFLSHADVEPAFCLLFVMECLPSPAPLSAESPVLRALTQRLTASCAGQARSAMLVLIFTHFTTLMQVSCRSAQQVSTCIVGTTHNGRQRLFYIANSMYISHVTTLSRYLAG